MWLCVGSELPDELVCAQSTIARECGARDFLRMERYAVVGSPKEFGDLNQPTSTVEEDAEEHRALLAADLCAPEAMQEFRVVEYRYATAKSHFE